MVLNLANNVEIPGRGHGNSLIGQPGIRDGGLVNVKLDGGAISVLDWVYWPFDFAAER